MSEFKKHQTLMEAPSRISTLLELRVPFELVYFLLNRKALKGAPAGDGSPVLLIPGFLATPLSMRPLRKYLAKLGYEAHDWDIGRNRGKVEKYVHQVAVQLTQLKDTHAQPVHLVGWSLGGVISREVARLYPELVGQIITLGSPISGGPKYTAFGKGKTHMGDWVLDDLEKDIYERNMQGLSHSVTSIFSRKDGVVGWQASKDIYNAHAENIEVSCSHMALTTHPGIWRIIADTLAGTDKC